MFYNFTKNSSLWLSLLAAIITHTGGAPVGSGENYQDDNSSIYFSVNPKNHLVELNWFDIDLSGAGESTILVTDGVITNATVEDFEGESRWALNNGRELLFDLLINTSDGNAKTLLKFNFADHRRLDFDTGCYGFWYNVVVDGVITKTGCMRTEAHWMDEMRDKIESKKFRQLFIPGTHDSSSYKYNFDPNRMETLVSRYTLTQDDDILSQLIHGVRYIDMRVGYYRSNNEKFWANHGISRLHPLSDVLRQVKEFVDATNEIVILDFQEFPVGFGKSIDIHKQLAFFLFQQLEHYAADPELTWDASLGEIWRSGKRIIVAYDHYSMVQTENTHLLWQSVRQRWGKVKDGADQLETFLRQSRANLTKEFQTSRPFAEMAEMTPEAVDVLTNRYGGLRQMSNSVNWRVSKLYQGDFGHFANIVAVDFYRATNIVESAIRWNKRNFREHSRQHSQ